MWSGFRVLAGTGTGYIESFGGFIYLGFPVNEISFFFLMISFGQRVANRLKRLKQSREIGFLCLGCKDFETIIKMSLENNTGLNHMKFPFLQVKSSCISAV